MREFIDVTAEMAAHAKSLDAIAKAIAQGDQVVSAFVVEYYRHLRCYS